MGNKDISPTVTVNDIMKNMSASLRSKKEVCMIIIGMVMLQLAPPPIGKGCDGSCISCLQL